MLVLAVSSLLAAGSAHSTPPAYVAGTWIDVTGHIEINLPDSVARSGFGLVADHDPDYAGPLRADFFMLTVPSTKTRTQPPVEWRLESRDSTLRIALADVTGDGIEDLVTVCRTARLPSQEGNSSVSGSGTNAHFPEFSMLLYGSICPSLGGISQLLGT
jgi:hypothetical protein